MSTITLNHNTKNRYYNRRKIRLSKEKALTDIMINTNYEVLKYFKVSHLILK